MDRSKSIPSTDKAIAIPKRHTDTRETEDAGEDHSNRAEAKTGDGGEGEGGDGARLRRGGGYLRNFSRMARALGIYLNGDRSRDCADYRCRATCAFPSNASSARPLSLAKRSVYDGMGRDTRTASRQSSNILAFAHDHHSQFGRMTSLLTILRSMSQNVPSMNGLVFGSCLGRAHRRSQSQACPVGNPLHDFVNETCHGGKETCDAHVRVAPM